MNGRTTVPPSASRPTSFPLALTPGVQRRSWVHAAVHQAGIFWDLDNISCRSPEHALVIGHRLQLSARRLTGVPPRLFAFANERTVQLLRHRGGPEAWDVSRRRLPFSERALHQPGCWPV